MREKSLKSENLKNARNPLLPAAVVAIQRATAKARQTQTAIVIERNGRIERIMSHEIQEPPQSYGVGAKLNGQDGDE